MGNEALFRDKPIWKAIFSLAIPAVLTILIMVAHDRIFQPDLPIYRIVAQPANQAIVPCPGAIMGKNAVQIRQIPPQLVQVVIPGAGFLQHENVIQGECGDDLLITAGIPAMHQTVRGDGAVKILQRFHSSACRGRPCRGRR